MTTKPCGTLRKQGSVNVSKRAWWAQSAPAADETSQNTGKRRFRQRQQAVKAGSEGMKFACSGLSTLTKPQ
jgi:hypothetical protein